MDTIKSTEQRNQLETERLRLEVERMELEVERLKLAVQTEREELKIAKRSETLRLRKLSQHLSIEQGKLSQRTGTVNIATLRKEVQHGILSTGRGVKSTQLREASYAWRKLLFMLRFPSESQQRLEAEGILRQLKVKYYDGDDRGKGYMRIFYYEPVDIPMMEPADVKIW